MNILLRPFDLPLAIDEREFLLGSAKRVQEVSRKAYFAIFIHKTAGDENRYKRYEKRGYHGNLLRSP